MVNCIPLVMLYRENWGAYLLYFRNNNVYSFFKNLIADLCIHSFNLRSEALNLPKEFYLMMDTFNEKQDPSKRRENN